MGQIIANAVILGCTYALMAIGLNMVYGLLKILHVAHAGIYTLGAYVGLLIFRTLTKSLWPGLVCAMLAAGFAGVAIFHILYKPVLRRPRYIALIASAGIFAASQELFRLVAGPYPYAFPAQFVFPAIRTKFFYLTSTQMLILSFTVVSFIVLYFLISRTKIGLAWQACMQDMDIAGTSGINVNRVITLNFFLGSALAGAAGILVALYRNSVFPTMGALVSYKAFVVVVLGGLGSMPGAVVAAMLLALVESLLSAAPWFEFPRDALAFLTMTIILLFRPKGLFKR